MAGLLVGLVTGVADAIIVVTAPLWAYIMAQPDAPLTWIVVIWTWTTVGCLTGALFQSGRLGRWRAVLLAFTGPGLLLLSRVATVLKESVGLSTLAVLASIAGAACVVAALIALLPLSPSGRPRTWLAASAASLFAVFLCGAHVPAPIPARADAPRAAAPGQRNVVLIFLDTVRGDELPAMRRVTAFSRKAVAFDNAWAPSPWTVPSHYAVLSGAVPRANVVHLKHHAYTHHAPLLAEQLQRRGYATAGIFANYLLSERGGFSPGFEHFARSRHARVCASGLGNLAFRVWLHDAPRVPWCGIYSASEITARARRFIVRSRRPYFVAVNYLDAHDPYYVEPHCRDVRVRPITRAERLHVIGSTPAAPANAATAARVRAQYRDAVRCLDRAVGELLDEAERDPDTVIAIVGDHGEQFGEHGLGWHGNSVYRQLLHVPLVLKAPGLAPARVAKVVSIDALHRTLLTLAEPSRGRGIPLLDASPDRAAIAGFADHGERAVSVTRGRHHFILWDDGKEALYDYVLDPEEIRPLKDETIAAPLRKIAREAAHAHGPAVDFRALGYLR